MKKVPKLFYASRRAAGRGADVAIERYSRRFLRQVAQDLRLRQAEHEIVAAPAWRSYGSRVTLRAPGLLLEIGRQCTNDNVGVAFRTRCHPEDLAGGRPNVVDVENLTTTGGYQGLLSDLRKLAGTR
ncbi:hypothetical protein [Robbsia andropogonis]|uniref:hypothetical protein n=1 Tax=Robbsia andropogonis TaxID=28092 RepID=UPI002A6AFFB2|nr:hypothetical protein [Robbsia andropogonis]